MNINERIEAAIIGDLVSGTTLADQIFGELVESNFDDPKNKTIFKVLQSMYGEKKTIDLLTTTHALAHISPEMGLVAHLGLCLEHITTPAHILTYIGIVKRNSYLRQIRNEIIQLNPEVEPTAIEYIMGLIQLRDEGDKKNTVCPIDFIDDYIKNLKTKQCQGITSGFDTIDRHIRAQASDLVVVGARTNVGKTTFLTNVLVNMLKDEIPCLYCPTEMRPNQFMDRISPLLVSVPADKFRSREFNLNDLAQMDEIGEHIKTMPLTLLNIASPNIHEIRMAVKSSSCRVLFLDYLGRCSMPREETRMREIERFMVDLKNICVDLGILCFLAVQLSRATDYNKDSEPRLADLSDSSAIEKEADAVIFLWRDPADPGGYEISNISGVLSKNRHGILAHFPIDFNKVQMRMTERRQSQWHVRS